MGYIQGIIWTVFLHILRNKNTACSHTIYFPTASWTVIWGRLVVHNTDLIATSI